MTCRRSRHGGSPEIMNEIALMASGWATLIEKRWSETRADAVL